MPKKMSGLEGNQMRVAEASRIVQGSSLKKKWNNKLVEIDKGEEVVL